MATAVAAFAEVGFVATTSTTTTTTASAAEKNDKILQKSSYKVTKLLLLLCNCSSSSITTLPRTTKSPFNLPYFEMQKRKNYNRTSERGSIILRFFDQNFFRFLN